MLHYESLKPCSLWKFKFHSFAVSISNGRILNLTCLPYFAMGSQNQPRSSNNKKWAKRFASSTGRNIHRAIVLNQSQIRIRIIESFNSVPILLLLLMLFRFFAAIKTWYTRGYIIGYFMLFWLLIKSFFPKCVATVNKFVRIAIIIRLYRLIGNLINFTEGKETCCETCVL